MSLQPSLSSKGCQDRAAECRSLGRRGVSINQALLLSRLADTWEALAIEVELEHSRERAESL